MATSVTNKRSHTVCSWCRSIIPVHAKICRTCRRDQRRIYEHIKFLLTVFGIIAVLMSAVTFVYPSIEAFVRSFLSPQLKVRHFATDTRDSIVENIGSSEVFLLYITIEPTESELRTHRKYYVINKKVSDGEVISLDLTHNSSGRLTQPTESGSFLDHPAAPTWFLDNLRERWNQKDPNIMIRVYGPDHPLILTAKEMVSAKYGGVGEGESNPSVYNLPHKCSLHYSHRYSERIGPYKFECWGIFSVKK